jgi:hypothetical protein
VGTTNLGTLKKVPIQQIWTGEATAFTPWLANNLQCLGEKLGVELSHINTEASVGDFSADIIVRDLSSDSLVVIENQYGPSDHKHLGQVITYAAGLRANTIVWIAETIRPEHRIAIDLLNQGMKGTLKIFALEASVIQIDDSRPAFILEKICEPDLEGMVSSASVGTALSEREQKYQAFFQKLIEELYNRQFTRARKAQPQNWYTFSSENSNVFTYAVSFAQRRRVRTEIYISCGHAEMNKRIFDSLFAEKDAIETAMSEPLTWERLDEKRGSRIAIYRPGSIDASSEELEQIMQWAISSLERLKNVFPLKIKTAWEFARPLSYEDFNS